MVSFAEYMRRQSCPCKLLILALKHSNGDTLVRPPMLPALARCCRSGKIERSLTGR
jgi:hypothetical protein